MRHRRKGRVLGRSPSHQRALLKNLASALFLTERDATHDDNAPKIAGRIITTLQKAKEVRPVVEKCITLACRTLEASRNAAVLATDAPRQSDEWKSWRKSDRWREWAVAQAPVVRARRKALEMLGDKKAVRVLFEKIAPRFEFRPGGYTRILRLVKPRLGDAGTRAILELVGVHDRVTVRASAPTFEQSGDNPPARRE